MQRAAAAVSWRLAAAFVVVSIVVVYSRPLAQIAVSIRRLDAVRCGRRHFRCRLVAGGRRCRRVVAANDGEHRSTVAGVDDDERARSVADDAARRLRQLFCAKLWW